MSAASAPTPVLSPGDARRLLLHAQGLCENPESPVSPASLARLIHRMGYVQIDSINVLERAHHLTLFSRLHNYRRQHLQTLHESRRTLFEHWTHDASLLPVAFFGQWKERGRRFVTRQFNRDWIQRRIGPEPDRVIAEVLARVQRDGPVQSRDFVRAPGDARSSAWWGWKPHKAALEYLWWRGDLSIAARINFNKVYDLTARVYPHHHELEAPDGETWVNWACSNALERLGMASPREIAAFFGGITLAEARQWCKTAVARGDAVPILVESIDHEAKPRPAFATADWRERVKKAARAAALRRDCTRLLSPFDPVIRDRDRARRLFGFDYSFEAFVPAPKRKFGYYVLPILRGERFIGRADLKHDRAGETLVIVGLWLEPGVKSTKRLHSEIDEAMERLATFIGAANIDRPRTR